MVLIAETRGVTDGRVIFCHHDILAFFVAAKRSLRPYPNISNLPPFAARILNRALASIKCVAVASATSRQCDFYTPVHLHVVRDTPWR